MDWGSHATGKFSEEQLEFFDRWMIDAFCKGRSAKNLDYCLRVHMQELLTRVFKDMKRLVSFANAKSKMAPPQVSE